MDAELKAWRDTFVGQLAQPLFVEALFDRMPDMVFSVKDRAGRYVEISQACAERCGLGHKHEAIGLTAHQLFPPHMADRYAEQDEALFRSGEPVVDNLDLTLFNDRQPGWCLSNKTPLFNAAGDIIGLACLSRDLIEPSRAGLIDERMAATVDTMLARYAEVLRVEDLAIQAGLTPAQFERRMKKIFQLSPSQFITKTRIDAAAQRLVHGDDAIADIALACGFCDQSALSKQFRQLTGMTPRQYRQWMRL
ncbi:AraC family transcriptional regulator [Parachitinimonas caeni]|uniref:AraC family transcriptional regulator n=1 Tax=Parachitinimonas caeni TaxID=3031301 RepID=A0ABT7DSB1_9NEIS|nr:AraC family transcriptional regulator [Parachitinimonas caeni]MDK2122955.1 AraC family transcriptional regulator [Parachitinimonas caeni]